MYGKCMVYHGLPVSKSQSILPWFHCFKTPSLLAVMEDIITPLIDFFLVRKKSKYIIQLVSKFHGCIIYMKLM